MLVWERGRPFEHVQTREARSWQNCTASQKQRRASVPSDFLSRAQTRPPYIPMPSNKDRSASPSLDDKEKTASNDSPPDADALSDTGLDEVQEVEENLDDLGGDADDGDDSNPHKYIDKSLHYQDMLMTKRHCEERVAFFEEFKKTMPKGKDPKKKLELYKARVTKVADRLVKFRVKYAAKRSDGKVKRAERIEKLRKAKAEEEALGKPLQSSINKDMNAYKRIATKAALEAVKKFLESNKDADDNAQAAVGTKAFNTAFMAAMSAPAINAE